MSERKSWLPSFRSIPADVHPAGPDSAPKSPSGSISSCIFNMATKPHVIAIPVKDEHGHQRELLREVHPYPRGAIQTVVEKSSINESNVRKAPLSHHRKLHQRRKITESEASDTSSYKYNDTQSDTSSNISNVSDLSCYENESGQSQLVKATYLESHYREPEKSMNQLISQKDLEIQLQNSMRDKECKEPQHFEVMKQNASVRDKCQLQQEQLENQHMESKLLDQTQHLDFQKNLAAHKLESMSKTKEIEDVRYSNNESKAEILKLTKQLHQLTMTLDSTEKVLLERDAVISQLKIEKNGLEFESKGVISSLNTESVLVKQECSKLERDIEDIKAQSLRDKSSHLEEFEANMKEREGALKKNQDELLNKSLENQNLVHTNNNLTKDLKHQSFLVGKYEGEICLLKKDNVVFQEQLKQSQIAEEKLEELKLVNCSLESSLSASNRNNHQVDEGIKTLKEDMRKLTSNYSKMKHNLAAKDKQNQVLVEDKQKLLQLKKNTNQSEITEFQKTIETKDYELTSISRQNQQLSIQLGSSKENLETLQNQIDKLQHELISKDNKLLSVLTQHEHTEEQRKILENDYSDFQEKLEQFEPTHQSDSRLLIETQENLKLEKELKHVSQTQEASSRNDLRNMEQQLKDQKLETTQLKGILENNQHLLTQKLEPLTSQSNSGGHDTRNIPEKSAFPGSKRKHFNTNTNQFQWLKGKPRKLRRNFPIRYIYPTNPKPYSSINKNNASCDTNSILPGPDTPESRNGACPSCSTETERHLKVIEKTFRVQLHRNKRKIREHLKVRLRVAKDFDTLVSEHQRLMTDATDRYDALMNRFLDLEKEYQCKENDTNSLRKDLDIVENNLASENERKLFLQETLCSLEKKNSNMEEFKTICREKESRISTLELQLRECQKDVEAQKKINSEIQSDNSKFKQNIEFYENEVLHFQKSNQQQCNEIKNQIAVINEQTLQISHLEEQHKQNSSKIADIETALKQKNAFLHEKVTIINELDLKCIELDQQMAKTVVETVQLKHRIKEKEDELDASSAQVEHLTNELEAVKTSNKTTTHELESRLDVAKSLELSLNSKMAELKRGKLFYQSHTTDLKSALNTALTQLKKMKLVQPPLLKSPPPLPLDTKTLSSLLSNAKDVDSVSDRLSLLRTEIYALQNHVNSREDANTDEV